MKLAFAIATVAALQQADVARAECDFGSNYTKYWNSSTYCSSFDVALGVIILSSTSSTTSSGDTNVTTYDELANVAMWKVGDKDSTVQCYPNISYETVSTHYPNGSKFMELSGDFYLALDNSNDTVSDGVPLSIPGYYFFKEGRYEFWNKDDNWDITKAEGDITDLCEVLGGGGGAAPAPTPTPPTTEAPSSSGQMAALTIIPCIAAAMLNYFFN